MFDETRGLIREAKIAHFYSRAIWPVHRKLAKTLLYRRCINCILNERAVKINPETGKCTHCEEELAVSASDRDYARMREEMNSVIHAAIARHTHQPYHALVLFSGGKDSCYMTLRLKREFPDLRILCLSFDNTFMSPIAIKNINQSIQKLGHAHLWVRPPNAMMEKMFRFVLLRNVPEKRMGLLDYLDGEMISDVARNVANRLSIPLILMGLSPEQVERILDLENFEHPPEEEKKPRTHVRDISLDEIFEKNETGWWWSGVRDGKEPARFLFPLYTWGIGEQEIKDDIKKSGVLDGANLDPFLTNHRLIVPMAIRDYLKHGYFTYEPEIAEMVRTGRATRQDWIHLFEVIEYSSKTGKLLSPSFDQVLGRLALDRKSLGMT